jgi:hypothetical protein
MFNPIVFVLISGSSSPAVFNTLDYEHTYILYSSFYQCISTYTKEYLDYKVYKDESIVS